MPQKHYIESKAAADAAPVKKVTENAEEAVTYFKNMFQQLFKKAPSEEVQKDLCFSMIGNEKFYYTEDGASILVKEAY